MRRFAASLVLIVLLGGIGVPVAVASVGTPNVHACCMRRGAGHHCDGEAMPAQDASSTSGASVRALKNCSGNCACTATSSSAAAPTMVRLSTPVDEHPYFTEFAPAFAPAAEAPQRQNRAPPASSLPNGQ